MPLSQNKALHLAANTIATISIGFGFNAFLRPQHGLTFFAWDYPTSLPERQLVDSLMYIYGIRDIFMGVAIYICSFWGTRQSLGWVLVANGAVALADGFVCWTWGEGQGAHWGYAPLIIGVGGALLGLFDSA
ncbi:hypothetical protein N7510_005666 [Penicillium lagena]|uniref:uncharacterized protein n=1 Tax=Penicillium lagena TaxID=94218 RepID=UPI002541BDA7|nr:uncharacterized protein N7510_005666 [Penicillium lagena]KAJ5612472.1 hypothetical protein N7510_005666 [Penicillium lagena]